MVQPSRAARRRRFRVLVAVVSGALLLEGGAWAAGRALQSKWVMYVDPSAPPAERLALDYEDYLRRRDPELGWPFPDELGGPSYDGDGSIRLPSDAALAGPPLVSLYGDSYVRALSNAPPAGSWPDLLARSLGRRVKNFGVSGHGTDQAYLRFRRNVADRAPIVVLGHMAEDMTRNLTRFRDLTGDGTQAFAFKPRFEAGDDGALRLLPIPSLSPADYRRLVALEGPPLGLEGESFLPGGPTGCVRLEPPYALAVARNLGHWRLRARLGRYPEYAPFYEPDHPLRGHQVTAGICRAFARDARADGRRPIVLLFPGPHDAAWAQRLGRAALFERLARDLALDGIEVLDFTPRLLAWLGGRDAWSAYRNHHFVPEVEPLVAAAVLERLRGAP